MQREPKEEEKEEKEEVPPIPHRECLTESSIGLSISPSEAKALSDELIHVWDTREPKDEALLLEINRKFDETVGDFPDNEDDFCDETVLILGELYHWLANLKVVPVKRLSEKDG